MVTEKLEQVDDSYNKFRQLESCLWEISYGKAQETYLQGMKSMKKVAIVALVKEELEVGTPWRGNLESLYLEGL